MPAPRQDDKADLMFKLYSEGHSLAKIGASFGTSRQSVYKMLAQRGLPLRTKLPPVDVVVFAGVRYTRRSHGYYASTSKPRSYLHRDVYVAAHGPIPDGYDVHHKDEDKTNNRIGNLELQTKPDHGRIHYPSNEGFQRNQFKKG